MKYAGYIFKSILEVKVLARAWKDYYNKKRPHSSLGYMTPEEYVKTQLHPTSA